MARIDTFIMFTLAQMLGYNSVHARTRGPSSENDDMPSAPWTHMHKALIPSGSALALILYITFVRTSCADV